VLGEEANQCPHRSKLGGLIGALFHWKSIIYKYYLEDYKVEIRCNGEEVIEVAKDGTILY